MRRENLALWIAALAIAGVGWLLNLAVWICELDPWGLAGSMIPDNVGLETTAIVLRHGFEACLFATLLVVSSGLLAEALGECPRKRKSDAVRKSEVRV
jgi:hypothetical protein